jgi:hypothetical protein
MTSLDYFDPLVRATVSHEYAHVNASRHRNQRCAHRIRI